MDTKAKRRILAAKRKARPELKDEISWCKYDYAKNFDVSLESVHDNIQRVDTRTISHSEFVEKFEKPRIPVVLTHSIDHWRGYRKWTIEKLARKYGNQKFKVGEDDDGYSVKMKMKYYVEYIQNNNDDSPLYIFDSSYADNPKKKKLRDDYEIPRFFVDDLFRYAGEKRRPPYRSSLVIEQFVMSDDINLFIPVMVISEPPMYNLYGGDDIDVAVDSTNIAIPSQSVSVTSYNTIFPSLDQYL
ncbi:Bifunctional arginine demethylase and lysyl-hydroxylase JMJD6 [Exaiptasia diaphana]|nr:Bifunctional arginine demethylase and lysyl-hydroxylase JMJD6 [Exaiptasia diaphana]